MISGKCKRYGLAGLPEALFVDGFVLQLLRSVAHTQELSYADWLARWIHDRHSFVRQWQEKVLFYFSNWDGKDVYFEIWLEDEEVPQQITTDWTLSSILQRLFPDPLHNHLYLSDLCICRQSDILGVLVTCEGWNRYSVVVVMETIVFRYGKDLGAYKKFFNKPGDAVH